MSAIKRPRRNRYEGRSQPYEGEHHSKWYIYNEDYRYIESQQRQVRYTLTYWERDARIPRKPWRIFRYNTQIGPSNFATWREAYDYVCERARNNNAYPSHP